MLRLFSLSLLSCLHLVRCVPLTSSVNPNSAATTSANSSRVDTHMHAIPQAYLNVLSGESGIPAWSLNATKRQMLDTETSIAILSISTPGVSVIGTGIKARRLARVLNTDLASYTNSSPSLGFFGSTPDWQDVKGTLAELDYLYQKQRLCSGIIVYTSYGDKLLGNPEFKPIWARLQEYKALVFIHPNGLTITPDEIASTLPQYVLDFLWATTRTAADLVMTGTMTNAPDIDVILAHAGGTLPYVATRALESLLLPPIAAVVNVTYADAETQFARFFYDTALSASAAQLDGLLDFAGAANVGFGSDYPYAPSQLVKLIDGLLAEYQNANVRGSELSQPVLKQNSLELLNKHSLGRVFT